MSKKEEGFIQKLLFDLHTWTVRVCVCACMSALMYTHVQINVNFRERKMLLTDLQACHLNFGMRWNGG